MHVSPLSPSRRRSPAFGAGAALAATLALGWTIPAPMAPGLAPLALAAGWAPGAALSTALGIGLLAWQIARLAVLPRADRRGAALGASLTATLLLPGLGLAAMATSVMLSVTGRRTRSHRVVALMVQCGAALAAAAAAVNHIGLLQAAAIFQIFPAVKLIYTPCGAANDNPSLERFTNGFTGCWKMQPMIQGGLFRFRVGGEFRDVQ